MKTNPEILVLCGPRAHEVANKIISRGVYVEREGTRRTCTAQGVEFSSVVLELRRTCSCK